MKMAVGLLQQLVLRNTVYVCGKYVFGWMCGLTAIPFGLNLNYVSCFYLPTIFVYLTLAGNSSCKMMGIML